MDRKMKLCTFFGTFNPIHNAHIELAQYVEENYNFDKIIFVPAFCPPHKTTDSKMANHRLKMVQLALEKYPEFEVSDIEFNLGEISYTFYSIEKFYEIYEIDGKINFLIGTDAFWNIKTWHRIDELKDMVKFLVFPRNGSIVKEKFEKLREEGFDFEMLDVEPVDISSTLIRLKKEYRQSISDIIPPVVEDYIVKNGLYED